MTPAARITASIECLDRILSGTAAEKVLTSWARGNRYAGSSDRAAIRDHVFDALRQKRSFGWLGQGDTGRALMIGALRRKDQPPEAFFSDARFAPPPLTDGESKAPPPLSTAPDPVRFDCPDWLWPLITRVYPSEAGAVMTAMQSRAAVMLRLNVTKTDQAGAIAALLAEDIDAKPHALSPTALQVTRNPRRVQQSKAYKDGLVELQDGASQAVVDRVLPLANDKTVLDYCAGGGGKALALAAGGAGQVTAHDADPGRMQDIPIRAARAGTPIKVSETPEGLYDLVLCDAPCSGTGAWRRQPDAKWRLSEDRLGELTGLQDDILDQALSHVASNGHLAYVTCSLLDVENEDRTAAFLSRHPDWSELDRQRFSPLDGGDGFYLSIFKRINEN
jgi:16S rRNA (cytosine967-C5)-methyltransferase